MDSIQLLPTIVLAVLANLLTLGLVSVYKKSRKVLATQAVRTWLKRIFNKELPIVIADLVMILLDAFVVYAEVASPEPLTRKAMFTMIFFTLATLFFLKLLKEQIVSYLIILFNIDSK